MKTAILAEIRKLLTVRSTYLILLLAGLLIVFFAGFIEGFKASPEALQSPSLLASESSSAITAVGFILAFAGILLVCHEYRYGTIAYTLTLSNSRVRTLFAKFIVISAFAFITSLVAIFLSPLMTILGAALAGHDIPAQSYPVLELLWRCMFAGWGYAMYGFILSTIIRNQTGVIIAFLLVPLIGEGILTALLKENSAYLPFQALSIIASGSSPEHVAFSRIVLAVLSYLLVGGVAAFLLFKRRDAS